jgi:hypothetical protein
LRLTATACASTPRGALTHSFVAEVRQQEPALLVLVSNTWLAELEA